MLIAVFFCFSFSLSLEVRMAYALPTKVRVSSFEAADIGSREATSLSFIDFSASVGVAVCFGLLYSQCILIPGY